MLVLKILEGQKIYIDDGAVTLTLLKREGNWAKIGIDAPREIKVMRQGACPEGPSRCCKCGGLLPPADSTGVRVTYSTGCPGAPDRESDRCPAFMASPLWGDEPVEAERKGGAA